jgi:hypothetical protein
VEAEEKLDFFAADHLPDRFHAAFAARAQERVATPDLENEVAPQGAHFAGG